MVKVTCDSCQELFEMNTVTKKLGTDIKETYFNCTACGKKYISYRTDSKIRRKQKFIRDKINKLKWVYDPKLLELMQKDIDNEKEELRKMLAELMEGVRD